ncbi:C40 family peptidase [Cohnella yongneupensis]|uniref:C40 family peptidase n=1 Tax=Cohnella yongneupensis TaxID=425006 RepID=A0ABW0QZL7_9BACL
MNTHIRNGKTKTIVALMLALFISIGGFAGLGISQAHAASSGGVIATGERYMGVPYKFGAPSGKTNRFDCSSFTQYVFAQNGIHLPRSAKQQSKVGSFVPRNQLQPGDLVFFYSPIHHVGIYIGNGQVLHTYGKPGVTISNMNSGWWSSHYATARRVM